MRPIDADALREYWLYNGRNERVYDTNDFLDSIDDEPTLDITSVVHAKWVRGVKGGWRCSKCLFKSEKKTDDPGTLPNYCERCGSRMDLEIKG